MIDTLKINIIIIMLRYGINITIAHSVSPVKV